jgi:hypothetical protein
MLTWMASLERLPASELNVPVLTAGLLRHLQNAGITVLEVTAPDKMERRRRGKVTQLMLKVPPTQLSH